MNLGVLPGSQTAAARGVSADGSVVVGTAVDSNNQSHAFRWTSSSGLVNIGTNPGQPGADAYGVSGDGNVVVGTSGQAFRWTSLGMQPLGSGLNSAYAANADGSVVVGQAGTSAFRWTSGGAQDLGTLIPGGGAAAYSVTPDGNVVVGTATANNSIGHAFRWTAATGMQDLGQLLPSDGGSSALGVSADGSVVIGSGYVFPIGYRGFIWTSQTGIVDLNSYLPTLGLNLTGWTLTSATAISADGTKLVGYGTHNNIDEAWIVTIPSPGTLGIVGMAGASCLARRRRPRQSLSANRKLEPHPHHRVGTDGAPDLVGPRLEVHA
jgi:probable HAF family extracellular repeat protein